MTIFFFALISYFSVNYTSDTLKEIKVEICLKNVLHFITPLIDLVKFISKWKVKQMRHITDA